MTAIDPSLVADALLDGELDTDRADAVAADPALATEVLAHLQLGQRLKASGSPVDVEAIAAWLAERTPGVPVPTLAPHERPTARRRSTTACRTRRPPRARSATPWILATAAAAIAVIIFFALWSTPPQPGPTIAIARMVPGLRLDRPIPTGAREIPLRTGDRVYADGPGAVPLDLVVGVRLLLKRGASLDLVAEGPHGLHGGGLEVDADPQPADRPLAFRTPEALATVVGTRFIVASDGGRTDLTVLEGTVRLARPDGGDAVAVDAGASASVQRGQAPRLEVREELSPTSQPLPPERHAWSFGRDTEGWSGSWESAGGLGVIRAQRSAEDDWARLAAPTASLPDGRTVPFLFRVKAGDRLCARVYIEKPCDWLWVQVFCPDRQDNFHIAVREPAVGRWLDLEQAVDQLEPNILGDNQRLAPGDGIEHVMVHAASGTGILMDRVEIVGPGRR